MMTMYVSKITYGIHDLSNMNIIVDENLVTTRESVSTRGSQMILANVLANEVLRPFRPVAPTVQTGCNRDAAKT